MPSATPPTTRPPLHPPPADYRTVELTSDELATLLDALDSHEYWQIAERGDRLPVNNGAVWLPGDYDGPDDVDPFWPDERREHVTEIAIIEARPLEGSREPA